jgi:hypothetical protein
VYLFGARFNARYMFIMIASVLIRFYCSIFLQLGLPAPTDYPDDLDDIMGRKVALRVKWQPGWGGQGSVVNCKDSQELFAKIQEHLPVAEVSLHFILVWVSNIVLTLVLLRHKHDSQPASIYEFQSACKDIETIEELHEDDVALIESPTVQVCLLVLINYLIYEIYHIENCTVDIMSIATL